MPRRGGGGGSITRAGTSAARTATRPSPLPLEHAHHFPGRLAEKDFRRDDVGSPLHADRAGTVTELITASTEIGMHRLHPLQRTTW
ncbi:MAG TPA: hypothetical protein VK638_05585 [Edaphobacter sp.]|nr:hypothetical protein [Edaphobacter sp.]